MPSPSRTTCSTPPAAGRPRYRRRKQWARQVLAEFDLDLELFPDAPVATLTMAERQLFEVAKALVTEPKVLLLDEPTTALGPDEVDALHRTVAGVQAARRRRGLRQPSAARSARGRRPDHGASRRATSRNVRRRDHDRTAAGRADRRRPFEAAFPASAPSSSEPSDVLVVDALQGQSFGPVSFTLHSGEVVGIAGAEGNGQPQLFDSLAGRILPAPAGSSAAARS